MRGFGVIVGVLAFLPEKQRPQQKASVERTMATWSFATHCTVIHGDLELGQLVVAVAYDGGDPLSALAVINSTASQSDVEFVVITVAAAKRDLLALLRAVARDMPVGLRVRVCDRFDEVLAQRPALAALRSSDDAEKVRRRELLSPFNFAAFYLPYVVDTEHIIYLDTDTVIRSDIAKQASAIFASMGGKAVAAVEDCSQRLAKYVNFVLLARFLKHKKIAGLSHDRFFGATPIVDQDACVFNRGVVLFDTARWKELRLTSTIEELVTTYVKSRMRLWRGGVSQPPFLIALAGRYKKLPLEWNVRGVGRVDLSATELDRLTAMIQTKRPAANASFHALLRYLGHVHTFEKRHPYIAPLAGRAHVIHFTGEIKPWRVSRDAAARWTHFGVHLNPAGHVLTECRLQTPPPKNFSSPTDLFASGCFAKLPLCSCGPNCVEACAAVWHRYVSPAAHAEAARLKAVASNTLLLAPPTVTPAWRLLTALPASHTAPTYQRRHAPVR